MTVYVFPGQGSQSIGMGEKLFDAFPEYVLKADNILGYSIKTLCLEDPDKQLNRTDFTQPALFVVNALSYLNKLEATGVKPDYVAGHSLGEYSALFAAGVFDFESGLKLVQERGRLMNQATSGGMAAVIGLKSEQVSAVLEESKLSQLSIANFNSYTQIVISGAQDSIQAAQPVFMQAGAAVYKPLNVSGAFHSPFMDQAHHQFSLFIKQFSFSSPIIPVIANVTGKPIQANDVPSLLAQQINHPVKWTQSIAYLLELGETTFEEIGPGSVLTGLIGRIRKGR